MMEGLFRAANGHGTIFTLCRYGNVVASRGSVIPLWREQAARGEALTVTSAHMTRFWMSEADAVETRPVYAAQMAGDDHGAEDEGAEYVEMAAILHPGVPTREIGLRSIEKLHEDLVHLDEPALMPGAISSSAVDRPAIITAATWRRVSVRRSFSTCSNWPKPTRCRRDHDQPLG
jgi:FlaA1/EpsC-like NDP-sugar epimerase